MAVYKQNIVNINLNSGNVHRSFLQQSIGMADNQADRFGVRVFRDGTAVDLTGVSVQGYFRDPKGNNIAITSGNVVSGNEAVVVLPQACYTYEGQFTLAIKLVGGGVTGTMRIVDGIVDNTNTGSAVAPTGAVPTYQEILALYEDMVEATEVATSAIAEEYDSGSAYNVGDYCIHNGELKRCKTAIGEGGETWNPDHWSTSSAVIGNDLADLRHDIAPGYVSGIAYSKGQYVVRGMNFYRAKQDIPASETWTSSHWKEVLVLANDLEEQIKTGNADVSSNLKSDLKTFEKGNFYIPSSYELGYLDTNGEIQASTTRLTFDEYVKIQFPCEIHTDSGYALTLCTYDSSHALLTRTNIVGPNVTFMPEGTIFRITVRKNPEETISDPDKISKKCHLAGAPQGVVIPITSSDDVHDIKTPGIYNPTSIPAHWPVPQGEVSGRFGILVCDVTTYGSVYHSVTDNAGNYYIEIFSTSTGWSDWMQYAKYSHLLEAEKALGMSALHMLNTADLNARFDIMSQSATGGFIYTITPKLSAPVYFIDDLNKTEYSITYAHGSGNTGTGTAFAIDDTLVSGTISGAAAFVADKSDAALKIIAASAVTNSQRVIAVFYGASAWNNVITLGNDRLFKQFSMGQYRRGYVINDSANIGILTWTVSSGVYTITRNSDDFSVYGYIDRKTGNQFCLTSDGRTIQDVIVVEVPATYTTESAVSGFAFVIINTETATLEVRSQSYVFNRLPQCIVLGVIYNTNHLFFADGTAALFTNAMTTYANDQVAYTSKRAIAPLANVNTITPFGGTVTLYPAEYKLVIKNCYLVPYIIPGDFLNKASGTYTVDWSQENFPNRVRTIYYNRGADQFVALDTPTSENMKARMIAKSDLMLVCIVYNGRFIYTSGPALPGMWFINETDIYAGTDSMTFRSDLLKAFMKAAVIGDSLSVGYMYDKSTGEATRRMLQYSWPKCVMRDVGRPWLNLGTSGQNVLTWCSDATYGKVQAEASGNKCQAYVIGLGENDQSTDGVHGIDLGSPSDIVDDYTAVATTYYGGYARIIQILKHLNPDCKVFCLTNPRDGTRRAEYNEAVRYIVNTYYEDDDTIILVDLAYNYRQLFNGTAFLVQDGNAIEGGHFSASGYMRIASIMEQAISNVMELHVADMCNIAFIPYDTGDPTPNTMTE